MVCVKAIEETFRDHKDIRFGMGLSTTHIRSTSRRDRLLMLLAIAQALLTLLGAASERCGMDKYLKVNTVKRRTHSLFRQGSYWYSAIPNMRQGSGSHAEHPAADRVCSSLRT